MKKHLYIGLATTALTVFGLLSSSQANEELRSRSSQLVDGSDNQSQLTTASKVGERQTPVTSSPSRAIAKNHNHDLSGRDAATVYLRGIPVLTFVGNLTTTTNSVKVANLTGVTQQSTTSNLSETAQQATTLAARLNQLHQKGFDANLIQVRWQPEEKAYLIYADKEHLLTLGDHTILPQANQDSQENALRITNLIRRQLGNAPALTAVTGAENNTTTVAVGPIRMQMTGVASWYGPGFHGNRTANGERFDQYAMTAAHRTLPFGTRVRVTNLSNGRSVVVRINDRGPFSPGRSLDLSKGAASAIGMIGAGVGTVRMDILE